jgi:hypothetical protein
LYRPSQDLDFATGEHDPLPDIAEHVRQAFVSAGYGARMVDATGRYARLKARAWHDRFVIRDIIDLHAVADAFSYVEIESLARRHDPDLDLGTVLEHLAGVSVFADEDFIEYGLDAPAIVSLRSWVTGWYDDLARRLPSGNLDDEPLGRFSGSKAPGTPGDGLGDRHGWGRPIIYGCEFLVVTRLVGPAYPCRHG